MREGSKVSLKQGKHDGVNESRLTPRSYFLCLPTSGFLSDG